MNITTSFKFGASAIVLAATMFGATASAQDSQRQSAVDAVTDEIFVIGTKKTDAENVQDVPIAVTAFNAASLEARKVRTLQDLSFSAPNVSLDEIGTSRGTANFAIRGLGVNSSIPSIDPAVGVVVDGVYIGTNNGVVFDLFDLDSVEVMRGPQGILFGRNTTGGAVLINTGNPTDDFQYKARLAVEGPTDDDRGGNNTFAQAVVSGPLVDGVLNGKAGIYFNNDDGYFKNLATGNNHGKAETTIARVALEWLPTEDLSFLAKLEHLDSEGDGPSATNRGLFERDSFDFSIDNEGLYESKGTQFSLKADYDVAFGDGTITNIFGYRKGEGATDSDIDATPSFLFHSTTELESEQISNELRYAGEFGNAEVTTGLFYFNNDVKYSEARFIPPRAALNGIAPNQDTQYGGGKQDHTVLGLFGQIDYAFNDNFIGIIGGRFSQEEKDAGVTFVIPRTECSVVDGTCPTSGTNPIPNILTAPVITVLSDLPNGFEDSNDWSNFSPKVGFQYFTDAGNQFYGNYTKGFRSGGYNFRITDVPLFQEQLDDTDQASFDEEEVDAFELGFKYRRDDRKITLNGNVFLTSIADMQREVNLASEGAGVSQFIINTADADIRGGEVETQILLTDDLVASANVGIIQAQYTDVDFDISGDGLVNATDLALDLPRVPEATYGFGFIYDKEIGNYGALVSRLNFQHRDKIAYTDNNFGWVQPVDNMSANIAWETPIDGVSLSLYGTNLLDEVQVGGDTQLPFGGITGAIDPRTGRGALIGPNTNFRDETFGENPGLGTFSPLKKGRVVGFELTIKG